MCKWVIFLMSSLFGMAVPLQAGSAFAPVESTFDAPGQLPALRRDIVEQNAAGAAVRLDALLADHGDELTDAAGEGKVSLLAWVEALPQAERAALAVEMEKRYAPAAAELLDKVRADAKASASNFYRVYRRYPLTTPAARALALGADRAFSMGDAAAARDLYELAQSHGWSLSPQQQRQRAFAAQAAADGSQGGYAGPLPFDARWHDNPDTYGVPRYFPRLAGGLTFLVTEHTTLAIGPNGQVAWSWTVPKPWLDQSTASRELAFGRGPTHLPAVLCDAAAQAQVIVARQLRASTAEYALRAFRATDGRVLWTTETEPAAGQLLFLSNPAVAGQYVYAVAYDAQSQPRSLVLAALEITTGRLLWQTPLGTVSGGLQGRGKHPMEGILEQFWQQTAPGVAGDRVFVAPNTGYVLAVGRFDGQVRWSRAYPTAPPELTRSQWTQFRLKRFKGQAAAAVLSDQQLLRTNNTPVVAGGMLVAAPQDTNLTMGLDVRDGEVRWQSETIGAGDAPSLAGTAGGLAIFCGRQITAIDSSTGQARWTYKATKEDPITGPAVVSGGTVLVRTARAIIALEGGSGRRVPVPGEVADWRRLCGVAAVHAALVGAQADASFGVAGQGRGRD